MAREGAVVPGGEWLRTEVGDKVPDLWGTFPKPTPQQLRDALSP